MSDVKNIIFVGVGGQGTVLASKILALGLISAGYDVKMSEVHGMAQRGGSVTTQVRYGEKVYSPIIGKGQGDVLVSFETMESLRLLEYLKVDGKVVVNSYKIPSAPILAGKAEYPEGIIEYLCECVETRVIKATEQAKMLGNEKAMNIILLGGLIKAIGLEEIDWEKIISENVKPQFIKLNIEAFKIGIKG
jgi:indolepyruvate ferredoxin oxidoreductase beta subunit